MVKVDIPADVLASISAILSEHAPGRPAYLFGSRVTGLAQRGSDLDVAIGGEPAMDWRHLAAIRCAFEDSNLPFDVDVIDLHEASGIFLKRIQAEWVSITEAKPEPMVHALA